MPGMSPVRRLLAAIVGTAAVVVWVRRSDRVAYRFDSLDLRISAFGDDLDSLEARLAAAEHTHPFIGQVPNVVPPASPWSWPVWPQVWNSAVDGTSTEAAKRGVGSASLDGFDAFIPG